LDLKQIEYFVRIAHAGSLTKASSRLGVAQPALSKQVRRLELELRQTLFKRHGRGVTLTESGKAVLRQAEHILQAVTELGQGVDTARDSIRGKLVIAAPNTARRACTAFIPAFQARFPQVSLEILEAPSRIAYEWLLEGRADIGILHDPTLSRGIQKTPLFKEPLYLVSRPNSLPVPASAPWPFRNLAGLPLILPDEHHSIRALMEAQARRSRIKLHVVLQVQGGQLILDLVQQGHGHSILPATSIRLQDARGLMQLNEIVEPRLIQERSLAIAEHRPDTPLLREARKLLRRYVGIDNSHDEP
jgi:LysR family transcriptional regulator, nitrogen assimilation regulatory protein